MGRKRKRALARVVTAVVAVGLGVSTLMAGPAAARPAAPATSAGPAKPATVASPPIGDVPDLGGSG
jgi:hypothetical protein